MGNKLTRAKIAVIEFDDNLDIVSSMVITAFSEQPMCNNFVNIQLIQHGIRILSISQMEIEASCQARVPC